MLGLVIALLKKVAAMLARSAASILLAKCISPRTNKVNFPDIYCVLFSSLPFYLSFFAVPFIFSSLQHSMQMIFSWHLQSIDRQPTKPACVSILTLFKKDAEKGRESCCESAATSVTNLPSLLPKFGTSKMPICPVIAC